VFLRFFRNGFWFEGEEKEKDPRRCLAALSLIDRAHASGFVRLRHTHATALYISLHLSHTPHANCPPPLCKRRPLRSFERIWQGKRTCFPRVLWLPSVLHRGVFTHPPPPPSVERPSDTPCGKQRQRASPRLRWGLCSVSGSLIFLANTFVVVVSSSSRKEREEGGELLRKDGLLREQAVRGGGARRVRGAARHRAGGGGGAQQGERDGREGCAHSSPRYCCASKHIQLMTAGTVHVTNRVTPASDDARRAYGRRQQLLTADMVHVTCPLRHARHQEPARRAEAAAGAVGAAAGRVPGAERRPNGGVHQLMTASTVHITNLPHPGVAQP
jgi:hypothetical protein